MLGIVPHLPEEATCMPSTVSELPAEVAYFTLSVDGSLLYAVGITRCCSFVSQSTGTQVSEVLFVARSYEQYAELVPKLEAYVAELAFPERLPTNASAYRALLGASQYSCLLALLVPAAIWSAVK